VNSKDIIPQFDELKHYIKEIEACEQYHELGFSFIPIKFNFKKPPLLDSWVEYRERAPELEEFWGWILGFKTFNIGLVTGYNGLYALDIDNKEDIEKLPKELLETAITETRRGYHLLFSSSKKLRSKTITIGDVKVEFKGFGYYLIEPPSIVNGFEYKVIKPITEIRRLPLWIVELVEEQEKKQKKTKEKKQEQKEPQEQKQEQTQEQEKITWEYNGKAKCIEAILNRDLVEGEREKSLFILFNLLIQHNPREKALAIVKKKNSILKHPLSEKELQECIFENKEYNFMGCKAVKRDLDYITPEVCGECEIQKRRIKMSLERAFNDKRIKDDAKYLELIFRIEIEGITSQSELAKYLGISEAAVSKRIKKLKSMGYLNQEES